MKLFLIKIGICVLALTTIIVISSLHSSFNNIANYTYVGEIQIVIDSGNKNNNATDGATKEATVDDNTDVNDDQGEDAKETHKDGTKVLTDGATEDSVETLTKRAGGTTPGHDIPAHIMQMGPQRTATRLQFELVCLCQLLQLIHNGRIDQANNLKCKSIKQRTPHTDIFDNPNPLVIKTHKHIDTKFKKTLWVFTTANKTRDQFKSEQYNVKHVQEMNSLSAAPENGGGVENYILNYATNIFGLPAEKTKFLMDFMRYWDVLRRCCGMQMSATWREELILKGVQPTTNNNDTADLYDLNTVHECSAYNIDSVEQLFMNTTLYQQISSEFPLMINILKTSSKDRDLFGTYCSQYNQRVISKHLRFDTF